MDTSEETTRTPTELTPVSGPTTAPTAEHTDHEKGATTAEYAITTLAACGLAAVMVVLLKSDPIQQLLLDVVSGAIGLGK